MLRWYVVVLSALALSLLAIFIFSEQGFDESRWYKLEEAKEISNKTKKEIFVFVSSKICPTCMEFKKFFSGEVMNRIESKYVPVFLEFPRDQIPFKVYSFPTFCIGREEFKCFATNSPEDLMRRLGV
ncbi:MAG: thioredoxin family protein [Archaeoglobaceae archaeon]|nr:thioredoxin family protein [Archaeoglobaceae archaeon]MDW8013194.1 thioredoxin family protein [Archaeoglobaceae archaeon]